MSDNGYNYIICICADNYDYAANGYGVQNSEDQSGTYCIIDKQDTTTAAQAGYTPGAAYPAWITTVCPNAPDATHTEAKSLIRTEGASGAAWKAPEE